MSSTTVSSTLLQGRVWASAPWVNSARYLPLSKLSVFKKISRNREEPVGLYLSLNRSKRWNSYIRKLSSEFVAMLANLMCVHVECIDRQIIRRQVERFKHLRQGQVFAITMNDNFLAQCQFS